MVYIEANSSLHKNYLEFLPYFSVILLLELPLTEDGIDRFL